MTTPGQVAPDGAYTVGGGAYKYGQALQEDFVRNLMMGGLRNISLTSLFDAVPLFEQALRRLPLDALRMAKPFFIGSTDADWVDVDTSVATIMGSLKIFEKFADFIKELERITGLNFSHGPAEFLLSLFVALTKATGLDFANGPIAFLLSIFTALSKATGLDFANGPIAFLASIFTALSTATGLDFANGPAAFLASLATQVTTIASNLLKPVVDGLADVVKTVTDLINGFFKLFGGTGTVNLGAMLTAATAWMTNWQKFVDGIWAAFTGGVAGAGKTVTEALTAVTDWLGNVFQKLLDEIAKLWGWTPGSGVSAIHAGIQDVVDTIAGILGIGQSAASAAAHANIGLEAIKAAQKSGHSDEFDYPTSPALPAPWWIHTGANRWGPDGRGVLIYKGKKFADSAATEMYVQTADPLPGVTAMVSIVLSRRPNIDGSGLTHSFVYICAQCSPTDKSCIRWKIGENKAQLQTVDAAGVATNVGTAQSIPGLHPGDVLALETTATDVTMKINSILQATRPYTPLAGRCIGFGLEVSAYLGHTGNPGYPAAELAGIAWHP